MPNNCATCFRYGTHSVVYLKIKKYFFEKFFSNFLFQIHFHISYVRQFLRFFVKSLYDTIELGNYGADAPGRNIFS